MHRQTTSLANVSVTETDLSHNPNGRLFSMHEMSYAHTNFTSINIFACEYFGVCQISIDWPFLQIDHFDIYIKFTDLIPFNSLIFYIDNITVLLFFTIKKRYQFLTHFWATICAWTSITNSYVSNRIPNRPKSKTKRYGEIFYYMPVILL